jgi:hypothetical protein
LNEATDRVFLEEESTEVPAAGTKVSIQAGKSDSPPSLSGTTHHRPKGGHGHDVSVHSGGDVEDDGHEVLDSPSQRILLDVYFEEGDESLGTIFVEVVEAVPPLDSCIDDEAGGQEEEREQEA